VKSRNIKRKMKRMM